MSQICEFSAIFLVVSVLLFGTNGKPHCEMTEAHADECGKKLMFIAEETTHLPKTDADIVKHCDNVDVGLQCLKKYSKSCSDPFSTQMLNIVIKNGDKLEQKYCKDPNERKVLLGHFNCNEETPEKIALMRMCMDKFIIQMEHIGEVSGDHRIPATCCSFHVMDQCVKNNLAKVCDKPDSIKYIQTFITELTGEMVKTGCGKFDNLGHCDANMDKKEWQLLKDLVNSDDPNVIKSKRVHDSPFTALKAVMKHVMEE